MADLPDINHSLQQEDLFLVFKNQLHKDFESCGLSTDFITQLPRLFLDLRQSIETEIKHIAKTSNSALYNLLYRIDISEVQIKNYLATNPALSYECALAELMIKRILQKVIFKKRFSS